MSSLTCAIYNNISPSRLTYELVSFLSPNQKTWIGLAVSSLESHLRVSFPLYTSLDFTSSSLSFCVKSMIASCTLAFYPSVILHTLIGLKLLRLCNCSISFIPFYFPNVFNPLFILNCWIKFIPSLSIPDLISLMHAPITPALSLPYKCKLSFSKPWLKKLYTISFFLLNSSSLNWTRFAVSLDFFRFYTFFDVRVTLAFICIDIPQWVMGLSCFSFTTS